MWQNLLTACRKRRFRYDAGGAKMSADEGNFGSNGESPGDVVAKSQRLPVKRGSVVIEGRTRKIVVARSADPTLGQRSDPRLKALSLKFFGVGVRISDANLTAVNLICQPFWELVAQTSLSSLRGFRRGTDSSGLKSSG